MKSARMVRRLAATRIGIRGNRLVAPFHQSGLIWTRVPMHELRIATIAANFGLGARS